MMMRHVSNHVWTGFVDIIRTYTYVRTYVRRLLVIVLFATFKNAYALFKNKTHCCVRLATRGEHPKAGDPKAECAYVGASCT